MAIFLLKRTNTADKRPDPLLMAFGELDLNYNDITSGIFYKNSSGTVVKVGPAQVSATAPNATPAGSAGNSVGEFWYDTSTSLLKIWTGSAWTVTATSGIQSNAFLMGAGAPSNSLGVNGEYYTSTPDYTLYNKIGGVWVDTYSTTNTHGLQSIINRLAFESTTVLSLDSLLDFYGNPYAVDAAVTAIFNVAVVSFVVDADHGTLEVALTGLTAPEVATLEAAFFPGSNLAGDTATTHWNSAVVSTVTPPGLGAFGITSNVFSLADLQTILSVPNTVDPANANRYQITNALDLFALGVETSTNQANRMLVKSTDNKTWVPGPDVTSFLTAGTGISVSYSAVTKSWTVGANAATVSTPGILTGLTTPAFSYNTFLGYGAGGAVTTGVQNVCIGGASGDGLITGNQNVFIGFDVNVPNAAGDRQLGIGPDAYGNWITGDTGLNVKLGAGLYDSANSLGTAGQVLSSTGTGLAWIAASGGTPAGADTQVQYNNAGAFGASSAFTFVSGTGTLGITGIQGNVGSALSIRAAAGQSASVLGGTAATTGDGGSVSLTGGDANTQGAGGPINLTPGAGAGTGIAGYINANGITNITNTTDCTFDTPGTGSLISAGGFTFAKSGQVLQSFNVAGNLIAKGTSTLYYPTSAPIYTPVNGPDLTTKTYVDGKLTPTPGGPTNAVQYNTGSGFGGEAAFSYDAASNTLTVASVLGYQGNLFLTAPPQATTGFNGNSVVLNGGIGLGAGTASGGVALLGALGPLAGGDGGPIELLAGNGRVNGDGGNIILTPGTGAGTGVSGAVQITEIAVASATAAYTPTAATDLTTKSYVDGKANPAGSTTQVQYNNAGAFGASSAFTFTSGSGTLGINAIQGNAGVTFSLSAAGSGSGNGSNASLAAGSTSGPYQGGDLSLSGGNCNFSGNGNRGGNVSISGGFGAYNDLVSRSGGSVTISGGNTLIGPGGNISLLGGGPTGGSRGLGGDILIQAGNGGFLSTGGNITINAGTGPNGDGTVNIYKIANAQATATYTPTNTIDLTTKSYVDGLVAAPGTITGAVNISNTTASTSKTTGALTVAGGVGVSGDVYANTVHTDSLYAIGTAITAYNDILPNTASTRSLGSATLPWNAVWVQAGSVHFAAASPAVNPVAISNDNNYLQLSGGGFKILDATGTGSLYQIDPITALVTSGAQTQITNSNNTTGVGTGSFQTAGGAYVAKDLIVTGSITANNLVVSTPNYATILSTATQTNTTINTAHAVTYSSVDYGQGITISNSSRVNVSRAGVYNFVVSLQVQKSDNGSDDFDLWFGKNGTYLANSTSHYTLVSQGTSELIAVVNFVLPLAANDYIELFWSSADPNIFLLAQTGLTNPTRPNVPSVILTVTEVK